MTTLQIFCIFIIISSCHTSAVKIKQKKNFDLGEISADPGVVDYVCEQLCSDHESANEKILAEIKSMKTDIASVSTKVGTMEQLLKKADVPFEYLAAHPVFMAWSTQGRYKLTLQQARDRCVELGGKIATYKQLEAAYLKGMDMCHCGWVEEGYAVFPVQYPRDGCFASQHDYGPGMRTGCTWQSTWNAWCFNKDKSNKLKYLPAEAE